MVPSSSAHARAISRAARRHRQRVIPRRHEPIRRSRRHTFKQHAPTVVSHPAHASVHRPGGIFLRRAPVGERRQRLVSQTHPEHRHVRARPFRAQNRHRRPHIARPRRRSRPGTDDDAREPLVAAEKRRSNGIDRHVVVPHHHRCGALDASDEMG